MATHTITLTRERTTRVNESDVDWEEELTVRYDRIPAETGRPMLCPPAPAFVAITAVIGADGREATLSDDDMERAELAAMEQWRSEAAV